MTAPIEAAPSDPDREEAIVAGLVDWFEQNARPLPWRPDDLGVRRDPWHALVSEIMAQQTQIARVAERFGPFIERFPTPTAMAEASEDDVLALWSGLGYYRRARHLHAAARVIVDHFDGVTPCTASDLIKLPGVGRYTAGAVASIAAHEPTPIVDGNVARVLVRLEAQPLAHGAPVTMTWAWGRAEPLATAAGADRIAPFNEGLMELGATICTPKEPQCDRCPLASACRAYKTNRQGEVPYPKVRSERKRLYAATAVVTDDKGRVLLEQRPDEGLWAGLWQAPTVEHEGQRVTRELIERYLLADTDLDLRKLGAIKIETTHRNVQFAVWGARVRSPLSNDLAVSGRRWVAPEQLGELGLGSAQRKVLSLGVTLPG